MSVTFRCTAGTDSLLEGVPEIEWEKDNKIVSQGKDVILRKDSGGNMLTIRNASTSDTGLYTCHAVLGQDRDFASAQLIVEGKDSYFFISCTTLFTMRNIKSP